MEIELEEESKLPRVYTKDFFFDAGAVLLQLAKRNQTPFMVATVKINDFNKINEEYGSKAAYEILELTTKLIADKCRTSDIVADMENGQTGIIFYNTTNTNAKIALTNVCEKVEQSTYTLNDTTLNMSVNIGGVVMHNLMSARSIEALYEQAKAALETTKGTSSVVVY